MESKQGKVTFIRLGSLESGQGGSLNINEIVGDNNFCAVPYLKEYMQYYKIWLAKKNFKRIPTFYIKEEGDISVAQLLFDRLPIEIKVKKYQEINQEQFERLPKRYKNIEEVLSENICTGNKSPLELQSIFGSPNNGKSDSMVY